MKKNIFAIIIILFPVLFCCCHKDCYGVPGDNELKIFVLDSISLEDISLAQSADNFYLIKKEITPSQQSSLSIEYGESPLIAKIINSINCNGNTSEYYTVIYGIYRAGNQFAGGVEIELKIDNQGSCNCTYSIANIELMEVTGSVELEPFNNKITLLLD
ncbi:MAG: hypothetical protein KDC85_15425 [Saprospiraceae bacterium]|nr:hypothetical protein [Saprospiraceae bacterium]MCB9323436.1 hypothetical protein [Lewinellaceae bacterium]